VLYDNTVKPRVDSIRAGRRPLIDIQESPVDLARRLARELEGPAAERAAAMVHRLEGRTDRFWEDLSSETSGTATKLSAAGPRTGARLMEHGYLSSLVLLHARFGAKVPDKLRGERYFSRLVAGEHGAEEEQAGA
jgi:hypothetical protein